MSQTQAQAPETAQAIVRTMITIDGKQVEALTPDRVAQMLEGMERKGRFITPAKCTYTKGIKVIGNGTPHEGNIGLQFIYNTDLVSDIAFGTPKAEAARQEMIELSESGNATAEDIHLACRAFMNAVTVSFSVSRRKFTSGQMVAGTLTLINGKNGDLITLRDVVAQEAEVLKNDGTTKRDFKAFFGVKPSVTELVSKPAPAAAPVADAVNAAAQS